MFKTFARIHAFAVQRDQPRPRQLGPANDNQRAARRSRRFTEDQTLRCRWVITAGNRPTCYWYSEGEAPGTTHGHVTGAPRPSAAVT
jgi:hypothetical protein